METTQRVERMRHRLKELGMNYSDLSKMANIPLSTVNKVLSGHTRRPRIDTMEALETALGLYEQAEESELIPEFRKRLETTVRMRKIDPSMLPEDRRQLCLKLMEETFRTIKNYKFPDDDEK